MLPAPGIPLPGPRSGPPGNGPKPGPTGSNLAPGGAPMGGRKPSPPHGPRPPPRPPKPPPNMGWLGPTNMPSPSLPGKSEGGAKGFRGNGSRSLRPISSGLRGGSCRGWLWSGPCGGETGCGLAGCGCEGCEGPARVDVCSGCSTYPSFRKPGTSFCTIINWNWARKSAMRFDEMKPWTSGSAPSAQGSWGKNEGEEKSSVVTLSDATLSLCRANRALER